MNPSYKRRLCGILAAACMLTAATVPAVSPVFSQVSLSVAAAEETDFYKGLKYLKYSDYAEVIDCDQTRTTIKIPSSIGGLPVRVIAERAFYGCTHSHICLEAPSASYSDSIRRNISLSPTYAAPQKPPLPLLVP